MNLLLAEDGAVARLTLSAVLKGLGYFPMVISDWQMPEVDGPELCRRMRALDHQAVGALLYLSFEHRFRATPVPGRSVTHARPGTGVARKRSEEHTSELQSQSNLVCRLLLEKKKSANPLQLHRGDDRAHVHRFVERRADAQRLHACAKLRLQLCRNPFLRQQSGTGTTHLPLIEPDRVDDTLDHAVEVRVIVHDEGTLAPELETKLLAGPRGRAPNGASDLRGTGKRDLVDVSMIDNQLTGIAITGKNIQNSRWQPDVGGKLGEQQGREGGELCRLDHDRASGGQCRSNLPREHEQRKVPRDDLPNDTDALIAWEFGVEKLCPPGVVVEVPRHERDVDVSRLANRFAIVHALEHGEETRVLL